MPVPSGASADYASGLQRRVTADKSLKAVAAGEPGAKATTRTYDGSGSNGLNAHDQDLMTVLSKLAPGRISAPVKGTGQITYFGFAEMVVFLAVLGVALAYTWRKKAIGWG